MLDSAGKSRGWEFQLEVRKDPLGGNKAEWVGKGSIALLRKVDGMWYGVYERPKPELSPNPAQGP